MFQHIGTWPARFSFMGVSRKLDWHGSVEINEAVLCGKPVIKGTRLSVEFIVDVLAKGGREEDILENYPGLTIDDIRACLQYASERLHAERAYPLAT